VRTTALVAVNVFRESVRDKVLYNLVAFALLLIAASFLIGQLTAGQDSKIIKDLGLAAISIFGVLISVLIGIGLVWKEVEKRSIYGVLSKPITRHEFILGKYFGLLLTLAVNLSVMTVAFYAVLAAMRLAGVEESEALAKMPAADPALLKAILLIGVELALLTAIALFFSTFSSPFLSAILTLALWVIGNLSADFKSVGSMLDSPAAGWIASVLYYVLPNFAAFDVKAQVVAGIPVPAGTIALSGLYGLTYAAFVLVAAMTVFSRRDFR
jgi:ABC-type transport system involved in multi-copper enzyme maturation permease subunit